ncbi:PEP-CTERM sorting domain-containing protein [Verrucomicrobia bacterium S94]|nr:PEP-CTERM sorting domain-containing protein [Verrucomicrobia bacterium S94]
MTRSAGAEISGTSSAVIGTASALGETTYTFTTVFTKTAADTWTVYADLINDGSSVGSVSYTANGETADLDADTDGGGILGGFQALPAGGGSGGIATAPFGPTTVSDFSIEVIPEPATLGLVAAFGGAVLFIRRRFSL